MKNSITISKEDLDIALDVISKNSLANGLLPISLMTRLCVQDSYLILAATDMTTTLEYFISFTGACQNLDVTVDTKFFCALLSKLKSNLQFVFSDTHVQIISENGKYKIPFMIDGNGLVEFPAYGGLPTDTFITRPKSLFTDTRKYSKSCLAENDLINPVLNYYCFTDDVITSNNSLICFYYKNIFGFTVLFPAAVLDIIDNLPGEELKISYSLSEQKFEFGVASFHLYTEAIISEDEFPQNECYSYLNPGASFYCTFSCSFRDISGILSLFFTEKKEMILAFSGNSFVISDKTATFAHSVSCQCNGTYTCTVDADDFIKIIKVFSKGLISIAFGTSSYISIYNEEATVIMATIEEGAPF